MRVHKLLLELKAFLEAGLQDFPLPDPADGGDDSLGNAMCFFGNVPDDGQDKLAERFPFVVIRWTEGETHGDEACAADNMEQVALILGVFAPNGPAEAELVTAALIDHLRGALIRNRLLAHTFDLTMPLEAAKPNPEKQQHQYHIATMITRWSHRTPGPPLHKGGFDV